MARKLTIAQIEDIPGSRIKLRCKKTHTVSIQVGPGGIGSMTYKEGCVLPRTKIWLRSGMWQRADDPIS